MDIATARARLKSMVAADSASVLSADELSSLLSSVALMDSAGRVPTDTDWVPTYDLNRAAVEGWRWKAAKLIGAYDFQADGASYSRSQMLAHCEKMAAQYARGLVGSVPVFSALAAAYPSEDEDI